jgi:peptidoglycan hydrolase-like protein with peptidoglycan-binding domain
MDLKTIQQIVGVTPDGVNGPKTQAAIKSYQSAHGLVADGVVGPKTTAVMQSASTPPGAINLGQGSSPVSGNSALNGGSTPGINGANYAPIMAPKPVTSSATIPSNNSKVVTKDKSTGIFTGTPAPAPTDSSPTPQGNSAFTTQMAALIRQLQGQQEQGVANINAGQGQLINNSVTSTPGFNPQLGNANVKNNEIAQDAWQPVIAGAGNYMQAYAQGGQRALDTINATDKLIGPGSNQIVGPDQTLTTGTGTPIYGLGSGGNGADVYSKYQNLVFNTAQGQQKYLEASDLITSARQVDSNFQNLYNALNKYHINMSDYPRLNDLTQKIMAQAGGDAGAVSGFQEQYNALQGSISSLIKQGQASGSMIPSEVEGFSKELGAASLNPQALQKLYDEVKITAKAKIDAKMTQAMTFAHSGTNSVGNNLQSPSANSVNLGGTTGSTGNTWGHFFPNG